MRLAKLTDELLEEDGGIDQFFASLPSRIPPGLILIGNQVRKDGLVPGERILFSLDGIIRYAATVKTGRETNRFEQSSKYPNCFFIDPASIKQTRIRVAELEDSLRRAGVGLEKSLTARGWNELPNDSRTEAVLRSLMEQSNG